MDLRAFQIATVISTICLVLTFLLFILGNFFSPRDHYVSLSDACHVGVWSPAPYESRLVIFNDTVAGPYRGSIIAAADENGNTSQPLQRTAFGDFAGIYYRHFQADDGQLWTLMVSLWYQLILFSILPVMHWVALRRKYRAGIVATNSRAL